MEAYEKQIFRDLELQMDELLELKAEKKSQQELQAALGNSIDKLTKEQLAALQKMLQAKNVRLAHYERLPSSQTIRLLETLAETML